MPLRFVIDENLRGFLWDVIQRHNLAGVNPLDAVRVGDLPDLPLGTDDPTILAWAEREGRILVSDDRRTMAKYLAAHLAAGRRSPGVLTLRPRSPLVAVLDFLLLTAHASDAAEWENRITFIP